MTLRISLRDGEKVVINGAVIRASGRTISPSKARSPSFAGARS
jgi:hypothetical protein